MLVLASNNNLNTPSSSNNVLFRHVPTAASLLRSTMNKSRALNNANNSLSPIHLNSLLKKNNSKKINNTNSYDFDDNIGFFI